MFPETRPPVFNPKKQPLKIAVLFSGNAGSARFIQLQESPKFRIACALTDRKEAPGIPKLRELGIPVIKAGFREFCSENNLDRKGLKGRRKYFSLVLSELQKFNPDILMLSGFMKIITEPLLSAFENRILNVHPADLSILEGGKPKFTGGSAVLDALLAGENEIRASVHLVTKAVDCGPVIALSKPVKVDAQFLGQIKDDEKKLKEYSASLQEELKREGDDPALLKALELIAEGKVAVQGGKVFIEGKEGFFDLKKN